MRFIQGMLKKSKRTLFVKVKTCIFLVLSQPNRRFWPEFLRCSAYITQRICSPHTTLAWLQNRQFCKRIASSSMPYLILSVFFLSVSFCASEIVKKNRIVSLMPSYTEIVFALGAGEQLVGVSNFCNYPKEALDKEKTGDYLRPNFEKIYALKPDIIFAPQWKNSILLKNLKSLGLNVAQFKDEREIGDIFKTIRIIADKTNKKKEGKALIKKLKKRLKDISKKTISNKRKPKVYIEVDNKYWTAGKNSFLSDVIEKAGGENIFSDIKKAYFQTSWETIIEKNPDIIISLWGDAGDYTKKPLAKKINALVNSRIISDMERDKISRPALRVFDIIEELALKFKSNEDK